MNRTLLALLIALPHPLFAGSFKPPEGCTTYLTVQSRGCRVSNHYTCTADNPGDKWRADADQQGVYFLSRIDNEAQWVESIDLGEGSTQSLAAGASDPASFSALMQGSDTFAFSLDQSNGTRTDVTGFDRLTGRSVTIDGVALQETEFEFTETDAAGTVLRHSRGNEYVHPGWRMFFAGPSEWEVDGEWQPVDGSPIKFIEPGEPGFEAGQPIFDCDAVLSFHLDTQQAAEGQRHDTL